MQLVQKGFLVNETFYKSAKHFQTIYLVSIDFNLPFTELELLYFKKSYQNFKRKRSEKDQLSGLPRKAELYQTLSHSTMAKQIWQDTLPNT